MENHWFKKWGWVYRPDTIVGWVLTIVAFAMIAWVFVIVDRHSHSVSDTLIGTFPWVWIILATLNWIASKTSL